MKSFLIALLFTITGAVFASEQINNFRLIEAQSSSLLIEFEMNDFEIKKDKDYPEFDTIETFGTDVTADYGNPELPLFSTMISLPGRGTVSINMEITDSETISGIKIKPSLDDPNKEEIEFYLNSEFYNSGINYPYEQLSISDPAIMRDLRVAAVTFVPFKYNDAKGILQVIKKANIRVEFSEQEKGLNEKIAERSVSGVFNSIYKQAVLNYAETSNRSESQKSILYIIKDDPTMINALNNLVTWRRQMGYLVTVATTSQTGNTNSSIKTYIQNAYDNWDNPPDYVVLVGDMNGSYAIPTWTISYYSAIGDHPYAL
ncbi:MAG: C25 family peptidase propeptide domain-containing protein, partial [Candidatus Cloacimonetes bacterium]|nr:C25 family peptidase propeptide domain-containing protein [Candidatus Cloacimonadota bacterium]